MGVILKWQRLLNRRLPSLETSYLYNTIETTAEEKPEKEKYQNHGKFPFTPSSTPHPPTLKKQDQSTSVSPGDGSRNTRVWVTMGNAIIIFNDEN